MQRLSVYFFNKDGHQGNNRLRDYLLELKPPAATVAQAESKPTLARARVRDFWGGVYQQFAVRGPGSFWLKVGRNNSFNTTLCGVFVDRLAGPATRYEGRRDLWLGEVRYAPPALKYAAARTPARPDAPAGSGVATVAAARALWRGLNSAYARQENQGLQWPYRLQAYRAVAALLPAPGMTAAQVEALQGVDEAELKALLANWRWQLALWDEADRREFAASMLRGPGIAAEAESATAYGAA